jgi:hypothetical protein
MDCIRACGGRGRGRSIGATECIPVGPRAPSPESCPEPRVLPVALYSCFTHLPLRRLASGYCIALHQESEDLEFVWGAGEREPGRPGPRPHLATGLSRIPLPPATPRKGFRWHGTPQVYLFDSRNVHDVWPFYGATVDRVGIITVFAGEAGRQATYMFPLAGWILRCCCVGSQRVVKGCCRRTDAPSARFTVRALIQKPFSPGQGPRCIPELGTTAARAAGGLRQALGEGGGDNGGGGSGGCGCGGGGGGGGQHTSSPSGIDGSVGRNKSCTRWAIFGKAFGFGRRRPGSTSAFAFGGGVRVGMGGKSVRTGAASAGAAEGGGGGGGGCCGAGGGGSGWRARWAATHATSSDGGAFGGQFASSMLSKLR